MATDPSIFLALESAVAADPENLALRAHLAHLYSGASENAKALAHVAEVLKRKPDHLEALQLGATVAGALGETQLAESYSRLAKALGGNTIPNLDRPPIGGFEDDPTPIRVEADAPPVIPLDAEASRVRLSDVAGLADVKERIDLAFLGPLRNPEIRKMYGKTLRGGLLLYGPPGCGKTFLAKAIAGEMGMQFVTIGLNDVLNMWLGESERQLHDLFEAARRIRPCVLFMDEIDAVGRKRSLQRGSAGSSVVNQLLNELDGVDVDNEGLYVIAATNHPWDVDAALKRPGRFDRTVFVSPPDAAAREAIFQSNLREKPHTITNFGELAKLSHDFSGADVAHAVESATEVAMADAIRAGKVRPIEANDFKRVLKDMRPSTRTWFETAKNYALFANEGGAYDALVEYMRSRKLL